MNNCCILIPPIPGPWGHNTTPKNRPLLSLHPFLSLHPVFAPLWLLFSSRLPRPWVSNSGLGIASRKERWFVCRIFCSLFLPALFVRLVTLDFLNAPCIVEAFLGNLALALSSSSKTLLIISAKCQNINFEFQKRIFQRLGSWTKEAIRRWYYAFARRGPGQCRTKWSFFAARGKTGDGRHIVQPSSGLVGGGVGLEMPFLAFCLGLRQSEVHFLLLKTMVLIWEL